MPNPLAEALTDAVIRRLASGQTYQRGADYFTHGHVGSLEELGDGVSAVVRGNQNYNVTLTADEGVLDYACGCPVGSEGDFCKHCVAAALGWLHRGDQLAKSSSRGKPKQITLAAAGKILQAEDKETLLGLMREWAKDNKRLRERLIIYAARRSSPGSAAAEVLRAFEKAVNVRGHLSYHKARSWARGVSAAIGPIEQLLKDGQAAAVVEICESALSLLLDAIASMDEGGDHFDGLTERLEDLHFQACQEARPDPVALAKRLFHAELQSDGTLFECAAQQYAEILGPKGMQAYRELAEAEWAKVPALRAGERSSRSVPVVGIMESLSRASGDVEELVAVMSRDLTTGYSYLRIAEAYRQAGQADKALLWAEKGFNAFPEHTDSRLRAFAAEEYHRRGRHGDAMKLVWSEFRERPYLETYKMLEGHAKKAGAWPEWRDRALADFRQRIADAKQRAQSNARPQWMQTAVDHSPLVEIFLYEENVDEAWREAQQEGCSDHLWLRLAAAREGEHPEDAAPIYLKQAEAIVPSRSGDYEDAVALLIKAAAVMRRMGQGPEFLRRLEALRTTYKARRNFIKLVEQNRKSLYLS